MKLIRLSFNSNKNKLKVEKFDVVNLCRDPHSVNDLCFYFSKRKKEYGVFYFENDGRINYCYGILDNKTHYSFSVTFIGESKLRKYIEWSKSYINKLSNMKGAKK